MRKCPSESVQILNCACKNAHAQLKTCTCSTEKWRCAPLKACTCSSVSMHMLNWKCALARVHMLNWKCAHAQMKACTCSTGSLHMFYCKPAHAQVKVCICSDENIHAYSPLKALAPLELRILADYNVFHPKKCYFWCKKRVCEVKKLHKNCKKSVFLEVWSEFWWIWKFGPKNAEMAIFTIFVKNIILKVSNPGPSKRNM